MLIHTQQMHKFHNLIFWEENTEFLLSPSLPISHHCWSWPGFLDSVTVTLTFLALTTVNFNNPIYKVFLLNLEYNEDTAIHNPVESFSQLLRFSRQLTVNPVSTGSLWSFEEFLNSRIFPNMLHASMSSSALDETYFHLGHLTSLLQCANNGTIDIQK